MLPVLMAQTFQTIKETTGIDMNEIVRANSLEAKTDRNVNITGLDVTPLVPVQKTADTEVAENAESDVPSLE